MNSISDEDAVASLGRGDLAALEILVERHGSRCQHLALGITRDLATAQDVVADSFLSLTEQARRFDHSRRFAPWFNRIVVNRSINAAKRRRRWLTLPIWRAQTGEDPAHLVEIGEMRAAIRAAFERLAPRDRAVVVLRLVMDSSEAETADALGCKVGTVKSRLARARRQLQRHLGEFQINKAIAIGECQ